MTRWTIPDLDAFLESYSFETLKEKYAKFRQWQQTPHTVAPMADVEHDSLVKRAAGR